MVLIDVSKELQEKVFLQGYATGILAMYWALQSEKVETILEWIEYDFKPNYADEEIGIALYVRSKDIPLPPGCESLPGGKK